MVIQTGDNNFAEQLINDSLDGLNMVERPHATIRFGPVSQTLKSFKKISKASETGDFFEIKKEVGKVLDDVTTLNNPHKCSPLINGGAVDGFAQLPSNPSHFHSSSVSATTAENTLQATNVSNPLGGQSPTVFRPAGFKFDYSKVRDARISLAQEQAFKEMGVACL